MTGYVWGIYRTPWAYWASILAVERDSDGRSGSPREDETTGRDFPPKLSRDPSPRGCSILSPRGLIEAIFSIISNVRIIQSGAFYHVSRHRAFSNFLRISSLEHLNILGQNFTYSLQFPKPSFRLLAILALDAS